MRTTSDSSYPRGTLVGFQRQGQTPPPGVTHFRTADGSWNNLDDPKEGAAGTRFLRNVELAAHPARNGRATAHAESARDQPHGCSRARAVPMAGRR